MVIGDYVRVNYKKEYIHIWYIAEVAKKKNQSDTDRQKTRSSQPSFNFKTKCFFCGNEVTTREKLTKASSAVQSKYKEIDKSVAKSIKSRGFDEWALLFFEHIEGINDLHAEDTNYHHTCYSNFKTNKKIPSNYQQPDSKANRRRVRLKDEVLDDIYDEVCRLMEDMKKNDEQITIPDLTKKMADLAAAKERECYSSSYLKKCVEEDFKGQIVITNVNGNVDVVTFHSTAAKACRTFRIEKCLTTLK